MATKKPVDAPAVAPPDVQFDTEPVGEPVEPTEPVVTEPSPTPADPRFEGKSKEEVIEDYKTLESHSGRLAQQLDEKKNELAMQQSVPQQPQQQWGQPVQPQGQPQGYYPQAQPTQAQKDEDLDNAFIEKPTQTMRGLIKEEMGAFARNLSLQQSGSAKQQAKSLNPQLFEGVDEQNLDQMMYGGVQSGMLAPQILSDPQGWMMAAWQLKGKTSGFQFNQPPTTPVPPQPVVGEPPAQARPQGTAAPNPTAPMGWNEPGGVWDKMGIKPEDREDILKERAKEKK